MKENVKKIIVNIIIIGLVIALTACQKPSSELLPEIDSEPTLEQMQLDYEQALNDFQTKIKPYDIINFTAENIIINVFDKFEATFALSEQFEKADYYNSQIVDIYGYIKTPTGEIEKTPAFYYNEDGTFALRYTPREIGEYTVYVQDEINKSISEKIVFEVAKNSDDSRGFISVSNNKFVDSNDEQFTLFATNYAWGSIEEFETSMPLYKENGLNFIRFWGQCPWSPFNLERSPSIENGSVVNDEVQNGSVVNYEGLGIYSLTNAKRLDDLFTTFEENDIYIMYCWHNLWEFTSKHFETNSYNVDNGGMCYWSNNDTNYWTHPLAIFYQQQALRYIVARYGYSPSMAVFEYWNECDNKVTADSEEISAKWHQTMDEYLKSIDIYHTPTTTSFAWLDHKELNGKNPWDDLTFLDIYNGHRYSSIDVDPFDVWELQVEGLTSRMGDEDKPIFFGEFSEDNAENKVNDQLRENFFKEGIYVPLFFLNTAGTNLHWRVNNTFLPSVNMLNYMKIASDTIQPFENKLIDMTFETYIVDEVKIGSFSNSDSMIMYVRDMYPEGDKAFYTSLSPRTVTDQKIEIKGIKGLYNMKIISSETGKLLKDEKISFNIAGTIITLPAFEKDVLISIKGDE